MHENGRNVVLNESSEALRNCSEIVWILVLAMKTADDGASGSNFVGELLLVFRCFTNNMVIFGLLKAKAKRSILVSKIVLTDPYVTSRDLQDRKPN